MNAYLYVDVDGNVVQSGSKGPTSTWRRHGPKLDNCDFLLRRKNSIRISEADMPTILQNPLIHYTTVIQSNNKQDKTTFLLLTTSFKNKEFAWKLWLSL